jgi:serine protease inhibitor
MATTLAVVSPDASLADASRRMIEVDTGAAAVVAEGRLVGMISERDLLRVFRDGGSSEQSVAERMSHDVLSAAPATAIPEAMAIMVDGKFRHLPVVSEGRVVGMVSMRVAINGWVSEVTREKIPELIPEGVVTRNTRLALVNALYLKAAWSAPFQESATTDASFRLASGAEVSVPTMHGAVEGRYAVVDGVQVLELPFTGGELALVLAIPRDGASEDAALAALGSADLAPRAMDLALPKFQVRKQLDLVKALKDLGVTAPFDEAVCDLSGINAEERLVVTAALHEAFVEVNEEGVEAAAATAILIETKSVGIPDVEVKVDQPFVFAIVDQSTRMPLFVGRIHDPR